ncbi:MAG: hypothetical protein N2201_00445 [candidate division WOR-3 bacterium]|nr:hypothetical protein [candidate division WOR-3 bacterium]
MLDTIQNRTYEANHRSNTISVIRDVMSGVEQNAQTNKKDILTTYPNTTKSQVVIDYELLLVG